MRSNALKILLVLALVLPFIGGCGDPVTKNVANRGRSKFRNGLRYEFQQIKTYSYGESQIKDNMHVIGYEPSWLIMDSLYLDYPYQLLSELVVGEYDMNPRTGFSRNDSGSAAFLNKDIVQVATSVNEDLKLTDKSAHEWSPLYWQVPPGRILDAVVGAEESSEFLRQSKTIADAWRQGMATTRYEAPPGNHFTVIDPLADPSSAMTKRIVELAQQVQAQAR